MFQKSKIAIDRRPSRRQLERIDRSTRLGIPVGKGPARNVLRRVSEIWESGFVAGRGPRPFIVDSHSIARGLGDSIPTRTTPFHRGGNPLTPLPGFTDSRSRTHTFTRRVPRSGTQTRHTRTRGISRSRRCSFLGIRTFLNTRARDKQIASSLVSARANETRTSRSRYCVCAHAMATDRRRRGYE